MIYLLIILFAYWNGYVIKWKLNNDKKASDIWHTQGFWARMFVVGALLYAYLPNEWIAIANPAYLLDWYYGIPITVLVCSVLGYWVYNIIINKVNGWRWNYLGVSVNYLWGLFFINNRYGVVGGWAYTVSMVIVSALAIGLTMIAIAEKYL